MTRVLAVLISTMIFASQVPAPTDMSSFAITYVDVMPASKAAAREMALAPERRSRVREQSAFIATHNRIELRQQNPEHDHAHELRHAQE